MKLFLVFLFTILWPLNNAWPKYEREKQTVMTFSKCNQSGWLCRELDDDSLEVIYNCDIHGVTGARIQVWHNAFPENIQTLKLEHCDTLEVSFETNENESINIKLLTIMIEHINKLWVVSSASDPSSVIHPSHYSQSYHYSHTHILTYPHTHIRQPKSDPNPTNLPPRLNMSDISYIALEADDLTCATPEAEKWFDETVSEFYSTPKQIYFYRTSISYMKGATFGNTDNLEILVFDHVNIGEIDLEFLETFKNSEFIIRNSHIETLNGLQLVFSMVKMNNNTIPSLNTASLSLRSSKAEFEGNTFESIDENAIVLLGDNFTFTENQFFSISSNGIIAQETNITFKENVFQRIGPIYADESNVIFTKNVFKNINKTLITNGQIKHVSFIENEFSNINAKEISVKCNTLTFLKNRIEFISTDGIRASASEHFLFHKNIIGILKTNSLVVDSPVINITSNEFDHVEMLAFYSLSPGHWSGFYKNNSNTALHLENNNFLLLANTALQTNDSPYSYSFKTMNVNKNKFLCSCENLEFYKMILYYRDQPIQKRFYNILLNQDNSCLNTDEVLQVGAKNQLEICTGSNDDFVIDKTSRTDSNDTLSVLNEILNLMKASVNQTNA